MDELYIYTYTFVTMWLWVWEKKKSCVFMPFCLVDDRNPFLYQLFSALLLVFSLWQTWMFLISRFWCDDEGFWSYADIIWGTNKIVMKGSNIELFIFYSKWSAWKTSTSSSLGLLESINLSNSLSLLFFLSFMQTYTRTHCIACTWDGREEKVYERNKIMFVTSSSHRYVICNFIISGTFMWLKRL